jgi:zinc transport system substrate-binding protein
MGRAVVIAGILILIGLIGAAWYYGEIYLPAVSAPGTQLTVGATIFPLADIARQVGGEQVEVVLIIPPGTTEHSHALTPQHIQALQPATTVFQIGHGLDDRLVQRITTALPHLTTLTIDRGVTLLPFEEGEHEEEGEEHGTVDPHYYLTVPNAISITQTIADALSELDPDQAATYQRNATAYQERLRDLERELQAQAQRLPRKEFIAMHNAWSYFAAQYGLRLVATYEPTEGKEPSLTDIQALRGIIQRYGLTTFYTEPQKTTSAITTFIQQELGLRVGVLDPVGGAGERDSYEALMRFNMASFVQGQ